MEHHMCQKEVVLRRLLESRAREKGYGHSSTWEIMDRLNGLLRKQGHLIAGLVLRTKYTLVDMDRPVSALILNELAVDWRDVGRPNEAELLLRQAVEIETRLLPHDSEKHPHRLNNLCTVLIMGGKLVEAKKLLRRAWNLMKGKYDLTSARILISRITICLLESRPPEIYIGRLKTLLCDRAPSVAGNITEETKGGVSIDYIKGQLSADHYEFLHALYRAANKQKEIPTLEQFSLWKDSPALPLDSSKPIYEKKG